MVHLEKIRSAESRFGQSFRTGTKRLVRFCVIAALFMITAVFCRRTVFASNLYDPQVVTQITQRMLAGLPTTLDEQLGVSAPALSTPTLGGTGYIIIGDSRITSLNATCRVNDTVDNWFAVACAGTHFDYLKDIAIPTCVMIEQAHPEITHWKYLINLGLTDLDKPKKYIDYLTALSASRDVSFVSINPTSQTYITKSFGLTNKKIAAFNAAIAASGIKYIDTYSYLEAAGYKTVEDGFHYDAATTRAFYQALKIMAQ